jgi:hypothetical protein
MEYAAGARLTAMALAGPIFGFGIPAWLFCLAATETDLKPSP